jgi:phosphoglycolate phosphatase-like HAD superfamily hydrolase
MREMRADPIHAWVFDVDGCMVDSLTGTSLRPGARELLCHLRRGEKRVIWWSAGGDGYARRRAEQFGLAHLVDGFFGKDERDEAGHYRTDHFLPLGARAVFVDDRPEDLSPGPTIVAVTPYLSDNPHDRGLALAARLAGLEGEAGSVSR